MPDLGKISRTRIRDTVGISAGSGSWRSAVKIFRREQERSVMRLKIAKAFAVLLSAMMALGTGITARADTGEVYKTQAMEDLEQDKSSLTINFHTSEASGQKPISGAQFSVYQVAAVSVSKLGDGNTTYTYKYYYMTDYGDAQTVILTATFDEDDKFLYDSSEVVYPMNM